MLKTRVITAVLLLLVLLGVLGYGGTTGWSLFVSVVLITALWEWARLGGLPEGAARIYALISSGLAIALAVLFDLMLFALPIMAIAALFWVAFAPVCLSRVSVSPFDRKPLFLALGFVLISSACVALLLAKSYGVVFLISAIAICWVADVFAYFFGKTFGKNKLAPRISPGKSWEGAVGGAFSVVALSWLVVVFAQDYPWLQSTWQYAAFQKWNPLLFSLWLLVLSAFSVLGDLFESMLKRSAGMKDSSQLLPGHGGVLDRIDAQLPALPLAMLLIASQAI